MALASFPRESADASGDDAKKKSDKHRFESDLVVMQSDWGKMSRQVDATDTDLRVMRKQYTTLGFAIKEKEEELKKNRSKMDFLEEEIRVLKKRINNL